MKTWQSLGIDISRINGQGKTTCPQCSAERHKLNDPCLSVNVTEGVYNCHHCGWAGGLKEKYSVPQNIGNELTEKTTAYFESRGISKATLDKAKVTEETVYFPQVLKERKAIRFNYFRNGKLTNIKYRDSEKHFKMHKDAEMIFYNLDAIKDTKEAIIVEGEIDCLSFIEAGMDNVVSVPNGANKNLDYVANCWGYFENKTKIYICVDKDEAGKILEDELIRRFGKDICFIITLPFKDANETLTKASKDELTWCYREAKGLPLDDIQYLSGVRDLMLFQFDNGKERGTPTHFEPLNNHFSWKRGQVTLFHGIGNFGKSTFVYFLMLLKSMYDGDKWGVYSPEHYPANEFYDILIQTFLGKNIEKKYPARCTKEEYQRAMNFIEEHFYYVYPESDSPTPEFINGKFKQLIIRHGITGCVIDPFNQLDNDMSKFGRDDLYISKFLTNEKRFALKHNLHKIIVAHPKVMHKDKDGKYPCPTVYDLHGGSMWVNKCDNILAIHAPKWHENKADTERLIDIQKIKMQQLVGTPGEVTVYYSREQNRFVANYGYETQQAF